MSFSIGEAAPHHSLQDWFWGCLWQLVFVLNNILTLGILHSAIYHRPGCFCPWKFFQNIRFNVVPLDPFTRILYRGVSGFPTDCPCGIWCCGLTTCLLYIGPRFGNQLSNNSWAVGLTQWTVKLHYFIGIFTYVIVYALIHLMIFLALNSVLYFYQILLY